MTCGMRRFVASVLIVLLALLPEALLAKERRGANLMVERKDGSQVQGELIAVREKSLLLLTFAGKDESVEFSELSSVKIVRKSHAMTGLLIGFLGGGILMWCGTREVHPEPGDLNRAEIVLISGSVVGLLGLALGAALGGDTTIEFERLSEREAQDVLSQLRGMARMRAAA